MTIKHHFETINAGTRVSVRGNAISKIKGNFSFKDKQPLLMKSGIVCKLTCPSGSTYIGQTKRNLLSRTEEHTTSEKFEVCKHLL